MAKSGNGNTGTATSASQAQSQAAASNAANSNAANSNAANGNTGTGNTGKILVENNSDIYFDSGSIIVMGVNETVFNTEIELKATNQSMMAELTAEQKNAISKY